MSEVHWLSVYCLMSLHSFLLSRWRQTACLLACSLCHLEKGPTRDPSTARQQPRMLTYSSCGDHHFVIFSSYSIAVTKLPIYHAYRMNACSYRERRVKVRIIFITSNKKVKKAKSLPTLWRHIRGVGIWLHSFLTRAIWTWVVNFMPPVAFPSGKHTSIH